MAFFDLKRKVVKKFTAIQYLTALLQKEKAQKNVD
jgi:hypothetical protein